MGNRRSFLRARGGKEDFAEISWTRRALEVVEGALGTPGKSRDQIFKSEADVQEAVRSEVQRLLDEGYAEHTGNAPVRVDPAEYVAQKAEQHHVRTCAVPVFSQGPSEPRGSRRGGVPWLSIGEEWPRCISCKRPLRFVLQVALADVANVGGALPREGHLQFFVCDSDCYYQNGWEPFSGGTLVRVIDAPEGQLAVVPEEVASDADFLMAESRIEGWNFVGDLPGPEELKELVGVDFDTALEGWELLVEKGLTDRWEKIGGWPRWAQEQERIACRKCGEGPMTYSMQLEATLRELEVLRGNSLYVLRCATCSQMTTVQQR